MKPIPPLLAERLLALTIRDENWRDSILGDLREEYVVMRQRKGKGSAQRWYWRHALAIGSRALASRARVRPRADRSWVARADQPQGPGWWAGFSRDCRYACRALLRHPGTSAVIIATLALAIATNSTSFAIMDALALRPFRFPGVERLVFIASSDPQQGPIDRDSVAPADFRDWQRQTRTVTDLAAAEWWDANAARAPLLAPCRLGASSCCSSRAPTSPTFCSRAAPSARRSSPCGRHWAPVVPGWPFSC